MPGRRLRFAIRLSQPVLGVTVRSGWLLEGEAGWAEWSPLPSWSLEEAATALRGAIAAAREPYPSPRPATVEVNAMVPRVPPRVAARMAAGSGCATVKVKVGDPEGEARVRAVRAAVGPAVRLRVDGNGAWGVEAAEAALARLSAYSIEMAEDPVRTLSEMALLRRRTSVPLAAEMAVRTPDDARELRRLDAADLLVVKPQRIGGIAAALRAAEIAGRPVIVSSALETSVGLATCLAVAAALPDPGHAHGIGTALLLTEDVTSDPLLPVAGRLTPRRVVPDRLLGTVP